MGLVGEQRGGGRSSLSLQRWAFLSRFLLGQKFTVVLISPFRSQSQRVSGCWRNFDPLRESDCKDLKLASASPPTLMFFFPPFLKLHIYSSFITEDTKKKKQKDGCC